MLTQCPQCQTVFRVTPLQLRSAAGRVRCGQCEAVFDALSNTETSTSEADLQSDAIIEDFADIEHPLEVQEGAEEVELESIDDLIQDDLEPIQSNAGDDP